MVRNLRRTFRVLFGLSSRVPHPSPALSRAARTLGFLFSLSALPGLVPARAHLRAQPRPSAAAPGSAGVPGRGVPVLPAVRIPPNLPLPTVDGRLDDPAWALAPVARDFVQMEPHEGAPATEATEARILFGPDALYVAFRAYDSHPDSIVGQLTRRDQDTYSDRVHLLVDSYFDRRTAFHFAVNPRGVKTDLYRFDDVQEDPSWDAVWDAAARVDSAGWTAEMRIPYSQLRFAHGEDQTWGVNFGREIARRKEVSTWAPLRKSEARMVSSAGEVRGIGGLRPPARLEVRPFTLARLARTPPQPDNPLWKRNDGFASGGLDLKYGVTGDLTLDLTVNPDFGQVEADPAQVNLTAFETFYPEKRPFFLEGAGIFNFPLGTGDGDLGTESLFYSRRIGRPPQGQANPQGGHIQVPEATTILGAWKLSGKTRSGWSVGLLHALTAEERAKVVPPGGPHGETPVEPWTQYGVARLQKDFRQGASALGFVGTATLREPDVAADLLLRSRAVTGGVDGRHRFGPGGAYQFSGYLVGSWVEGSPEAMALTQRSSSRYFQRPGAPHLQYDPTLTTLGGWAGKVEVLKVGGGFWRWATVVLARSPGFEPNDLGYQQRADQILHILYAGYDRYTPSRLLRRWRLNVNGWHAWTFGGEAAGAGGNVNGSLTLPSYWGAHAGINRQLASYSPTLLRGGPLMRTEPALNGWMGAFSDDRKALRGQVGLNWYRADESGSWSLSTNGTLRWRPSGWASLSLGPSVSWNVSEAQWVRRIEASGPHYLFARLDQKTVALTGRFDLTFHPDLTLQGYFQPFLSAGSYSEFKEVTAPRARRYQDRFRPVEVQQEGGHYRTDLDGNGVWERFARPDFNIRQFRSNLVLRWEYRPGSHLYLVWSQGRNDFEADGKFRLGEGVADLFGAPATNVFMVKASYWLGR